MTIDEVSAWFGNLHKACVALNIASQNMTNWKEQGYIPWKQQFKIAMITEGELMPDDEDPHLVRNPKKPKKPRTVKREVLNCSDARGDAVGLRADPVSGAAHHAICQGNDRLDAAILGNEVGQQLGAVNCAAG